MMTTPDTAVEATKKSGEEPLNAHYDIRLPDLPWSRRVQIPIIAAAVYSVIRMLGPTLRYEVLGWQHAERVYAAKKQCIWADRKSTRLNSSHTVISYAVFCLKKKKQNMNETH